MTSHVRKLIGIIAVVVSVFLLPAPCSVLHAQDPSPVVLATIWGEAADWRDDVEIVAIVHVLRNRVNDPEGRFGATAVEVVTQRHQFTANGGRQFWRYLSGPLTAAERVKAARLRAVVERAGSLPDITGGALYFAHDPAPPSFMRAGLHASAQFGRVYVFVK